MTSIFLIIYPHQFVIFSFTHSDYVDFYRVSLTISTHCIRVSLQCSRVGSPLDVGRDGSLPRGCPRRTTQICNGLVASRSLDSYLLVLVQDGCLNKIFAQNSVYPLFFCSRRRKASALRRRFSSQSVPERS